MTTSSSSATTTTESCVTAPMATTMATITLNTNLCATIDWTKVRILSLITASTISVVSIDDDCVLLNIVVSSVGSTIFASNGNIIAITTGGTLLSYDFTTGAEINRRTGFSTSGSLASMLNDEFGISFPSSNSFRVYNAQTFALTILRTTSYFFQEAIQVSLQKVLVRTTSTENKIRILDLQTSTFPLYDIGSKLVMCISKLKNGYVVLGTNAATVEVIDISKDYSNGGLVAARYICYNPSFLAELPDGRIAIAVNQNLQIWNYATNSIDQHWRATSYSSISGLVVNSAGEIIIKVSVDLISVWDTSGNVLGMYKWQGTFNSFVLRHPY
jgi:hypothetical protein